MQQGRLVAFDCCNVRYVELDVDEMRLQAAKPSRAANWISRILHPVVSTCGAVIGVPLISDGLAESVGWILVSLLFFVAIPYGCLIALVRSGRVPDRQVVRRDDRHLPNIAALVSVVCGFAVIFCGQAPAGLTALAASVLLCLAVFAVCTVSHKVSYHAGAVGGAATALACVGPVFLWAVAVVVVGLVSWARVRGGRHSLTQVVAGSLIASGLTFGVFYWTNLTG